MPAKNLFVSLFLFQATLAYSAETVDLNRGAITVFKDGVVTCKTFERYQYPGGVSCKASAKIGNFKSLKRTEFTDGGQILERNVVGDQICYTFSSYRHPGGISCIDP